MSVHQDMRNPQFWPVFHGLGEALGEGPLGGYVMKCVPADAPAWTWEFTDWDGRDRVALVTMVAGSRA